MKVIIGHFGHEANTFAEHHADYEEYTGRGIQVGEDVIAVNEGTSVYTGGIIAACREENIEMIPTCAYTAAMPILTRECVERMLAHILPVCEAHKNDIDGICIALHGAGVSEQSDDLETYVLRKIREVVGNSIPITVPMDLHGNVTQEMADLTSGLFCIRKYPHIDKAQTSYLAMKTLARVMRGEIKPVTKVVHLPLLIPISTGMTANAPFPEIEAYFKKYEEEHGLIHAALFHGFPYADVSSSTASVIVTAEHGAQEAAEHLAKYVWERRHHFQIQSLTPAEAFDLAQQETKDGYIIINEMSDNPGGGCPGDGTHLLREMLKRNLPGSIFGYIVDPEAVRVIFQHRPGDRVDLKLGGRHEKIFGEPLDIRDAEIISLSNGKFVHTSPNLLGLPTKMGKTARIRVGNVDIVIGSNKNQTFDDRPFFVTGADINEYRYVGLKSTQHFRGYFGSRAARIIPTDPPGLNTGDLKVFHYQKIPRPVYPLDENVVF